MNRFSLYEFMSFFLPGVVAVFIILQLLSLNHTIFYTISDFINGLLFSILAITAGLIIHHITFYFAHYTWYKKLAIQPIDKIIEKNPKDIQINFNKLNTYYKEEQLEAAYLFDKAYYYLEYHNKIAPAKIFQSMYYFLRNLITLSILFIPVYIIASFLKDNNTIPLLLLVISILIIPIIRNTAGFYRMKMVERVFNTFYIVIDTIDIKENNDFEC